jgi:hypothetical protein
LSKAFLAILYVCDNGVGKDFEMTGDFDRELVALRREIAERWRYIENQTVLIEVLERDGHDVSEQETALKKVRSEFATTIARQFELIHRATIATGMMPSGTRTDAPKTAEIK